MLGDRLAEGFAVARINTRRVECRPRHAHRLRRNTDTARLEIGKRNPITVAFASQQILRGHFAIIEDDLRRIRCPLTELVLYACDDVAWRLRFDDEG